MNHLAHLYLADGSPELMVGGLLADFLRGVDRSVYAEGIQEGIQQHFEIDRFTDTHPVFAASRARLRPPFRRYAGVLIDIFYDHFLAVRWERYSPQQPLEDFARQAYAVLASHERILPPRLRRMLPHMVREDWLTSYRTIGGVDVTLKRLSRRVKRENPLPQASRQLEQHHDALAEDFDRFFPELLAFVKPPATASDNGSRTRRG